MNSNEYDRKRRAPPKRRSSSYPPQYAKLLLHVANTGEDLIIDNLGNTRAAYTTFRARVNEFRRAYHDEALAEGNRDKMLMAEQMYSVTLRDPAQKDGKWYIAVTPREGKHANALDELLPNFEVPLIEHKQTTPLTEVQKSSQESEDMISRLYGGKDDE